MARKFGLKIGTPNDGGYAWATDICEDRWLVAAFDAVGPRVQNGIRWKNDFIEHYYDRGNFVTFYALGQINKALQQKGDIEPLELIETDVSDYVRGLDKPERARIRCDLRDQYRSLDNGHKDVWVRNALVEIKALPDPHQTFEEWKRARVAPEPPLWNNNEMARRKAALKEAGAKAEQVKLNGSIDRAVRMLVLASKSEIIERIIATLSPDEALAVAEAGRIESPDVVDMLVERSLSGLEGITFLSEPKPIPTPPRRQDEEESAA